MSPASPLWSRIRRNYLQILGLLVLSIPLLVVLVLYDRAGDIIFFKYGEQGWAMQRPAKCSDSRKALVYADMRPGQKGDKPLELSCEAAEALPARTFFARKPDGLDIHYKVYDAPQPGAPLMIHVSGLTSTYLDGARYYPMARRLGFQLITFDLSNHGISGNNGQGAAYGCREQEDVLTVVKEALRRYPGRDLMLTGTSMGTMAIANAADQLLALPEAKQIVAIQFENPPSSLRDTVAFHRDGQGAPGFVLDGVVWLAGLRSGHDYTACAPVRQVADLLRPVLVHQAESDTIVSVDMARKVFAALPPGLPHQFKLYPHGKHAAVWNGQPEAYERDLAALWQTGLNYRERL